MPSVPARTRESEEGSSVEAESPGGLCCLPMLDNVALLHEHCLGATRWPSAAASALASTRTTGGSMIVRYRHAPATISALIDCHSDHLAISAIAKCHAPPA